LYAWLFRLNDSVSRRFFARLIFISCQVVKNQANITVHFYYGGRLDDDEHRQPETGLRVMRETSQEARFRAGHLAKKAKVAVQVGLRAVLGCHREKPQAGF
jgi:hypothetical protein